MSTDQVELFPKEKHDSEMRNFLGRCQGCGKQAAMHGARNHLCKRCYQAYLKKS